MNLKLHKPQQTLNGSIQLPGSKSISNRILIIKALSGLSFEIKNLSNSDDTKHLKDALENYSTQSLINVGHAGTDMRFLTAFFCLQKGVYELTGSDRLQQRPIKDLVDVLQIFGADISYKNNEGFPPLVINGTQLNGGKVEMRGDVSSQFISALLLIAPYLTHGLELSVKGELVSTPYVNMTISIMKEFGAQLDWNGNSIKVFPVPYSYSNESYLVESDWSSASYYYSLVALSPVGTELVICNLYENSLQADSICNLIYGDFGVKTIYHNNTITISKKSNPVIQSFHYNFIKCPDIAQTVVCSCLGLQMPFVFTGLQTLKVKETDRIIALQNECKKIGAELSITNNSIQWDADTSLKTEESIIIATYNDHRMAMSFAPLSLLLNDMVIEHAEVVSKSYPEFWDHLKSIGIIINN